MHQPLTTDLEARSSQELASQLAAQLAIPPNNWHHLKGNRQAQAAQQLSSALVFLLKDEPALALEHLKQAQGWLNHSIKALPCPDHGH